MEDVTPANNASQSCQPQQMSAAGITSTTKNGFSFTRLMLVVIGIMLMIFLPFGFILSSALFLFALRSPAVNATAKYYTNIPHKSSYLFEIGVVALALFLFGAANFISNTVNALGGW